MKKMWFNNKNPSHPSLLLHLLSQPPPIHIHPPIPLPFFISSTLLDHQIASWCPHCEGWSFLGPLDVWSIADRTNSWPTCTGNSEILKVNEKRNYILWYVMWCQWQNQRELTLIGCYQKGSKVNKSSDQCYLFIKKIKGGIRSLFHPVLTLRNGGHIGGQVSRLSYCTFGFGAVIWRDLFTLIIITVWLACNNHYARMIKSNLER